MTAELDLVWTFHKPYHVPPFPGTCPWMTPTALLVCFTGLTISRISLWPFPGIWNAIFISFDDILRCFVWVWKTILFELKCYFYFLSTWSMVFFVWGGLLISTTPAVVCDSSLFLVRQILWIQEAISLGTDHSETKERKNEWHTSRYLFIADIVQALRRANLIMN
jgi:hypothetical protein